MTRRIVPFALATLLTPAAMAQTVSWRSINVGETTAAATSADGARQNPALAASVQRQSLRVVHASELQRGNGGSIDATSLAYSSALPFGLGVAAGATWQRAMLAPQILHRVVADGSLSLTLSSGLWLGARVRVASAVASPALAAGDGVSLDLAALYRPVPWLSLALSTDELLGPTALNVGSIRSATAGVALRPFSTDVLTLGIDGTYTERGPGPVRAGAVLALPIGRVRAEGSVDLDTGAWRAGAGLELAWSNYTLGGGVLLGSTAGSTAAPLGFYASAGWDSDRHRALPEPGQVVVVRLDDDLGEEALVRLLVRLERMRQDPSVRGVLFVPRGDVHGLAGGDDLREAFVRLRAAGKRVRCHLEDTTNAVLLACSGAERTAIDPIATVRTAGLRSTRFFLGDALAELGVRTQFVRIGPWKSAAEQFTRGGSSPEALAQEESLLDSMLDHYLARIASARRWTAAHAREVLFAGPFSARESVARGLIDESAQLDEFGRSFADSAGGSLVRLREFVGRQPRRWAGGPAIAVLHIHGDIVDGESQDIPLLGDSVGDRTVVQAIESIAASSRVAAVVVRVDSGGGSASASERMWRALARLARVKPVVTSIGRSAASGGYYVAVPSREIFTSATSITGSIGIFFGKADIAPLLSRLHVGIETTQRGPRADMDSIFRPFSQDELDIVGRLIREHYNLFLDRVAEGRRSSRTRIHAVAEGRVFTGAQALRNGLADREGGLLAAIDRAAQLGGLDGEFDIVTLPRADAGVLGAIRSLVGVSDPRAPVAQMLARTELARAIRWLYAVSSAPSGAVMAMTEWPILAP
jgi:protease-4